MKTYQFTVIVQRDETGKYLATCPALQGCYAEGETREEALSYLEGVIQLHIEDRTERKEPIYEEVFSQKLSVAA